MSAGYWQGAIARMLLWPAWHRSDVERFWGPTLQAQGPVLICLGQPLAYTLRSAQAQEDIHRILGAQALSEPSPNEVIPKRDLVILPDRYLALGDSACLVRLVGLF